MKNRRYGFTHSGGVHNIIVEKEGISLIYPKVQFTRDYTG